MAVKGRYRLAGIVVLIVLVVLFVRFYNAYQNIYRPNVNTGEKKWVRVLVYPGEDLNDLYQKLEREKILIRPKTFCG
ncbi:MAG: hypothetical protein HC896_02575 [Bacteroidales bacterium]|nr:hypothetical protein [Bacteroidales bacterium]